MMVMNTTESTTTIWPTLRYRDAPAAIRFLTEAFGFEEVAVYRGEDQSIVEPDEPDAPCERAQGAGANIVRGLRDEDYGSRGFTARDPEGVFWSFGTYAGAGSAA